MKTIAINAKDLTINGKPAKLRHFTAAASANHVILASNALLTEIQTVLDKFAEGKIDDKKLEKFLHSLWGCLDNCRDSIRKYEKQLDGLVQIDYSPIEKMTKFILNFLS